MNLSKINSLLYEIERRHKFVDKSPIPLIKDKHNLNNNCNRKFL